MHRFLNSSGALALVACLGAPVAAEENVVLNVGIDPDAAPFSHRLDRTSYFDETEAVKGPLFEAGYRGYVVQICDAAMRAMRDRRSNVTFQPMPVTTMTRFGDTRANWQILCDPASLTSLRVSEHQPTLPIYLSGTGFARLQDIPLGNTCQTIAGVASHTTTAHAGVLAIADAGAIPRWTNDLRTAVASTEGNVFKCDSGRQVPIVAFKKTHAELADALCNKQILYYIGDLEIVRAALARFPDCDVEYSPTTYRDERYTIFTDSQDLTQGQIAGLNQFRAELSRQMLRDGSTLLKAYKAYLGNHTKSRKLSAFYWGVIGAFE